MYLFHNWFLNQFLHLLCRKVMFSNTFWNSDSNFQSYLSNKFGSQKKIKKILYVFHKQYHHQVIPLFFPQMNMFYIKCHLWYFRNIYFLACIDVGRYIKCYKIIRAFFFVLFSDWNKKLIKMINKIISDQ